MFPFLYARLDVNSENIEAFIVLLASHCDYVYVNTKWMNDEKMPEDRMLRLDVDLEQEKHEFSTEAEALAWIENWWKSK